MYSTNIYSTREYESIEYKRRDVPIGNSTNIDEVGKNEFLLFNDHEDNYYGMVKDYLGNICDSSCNNVKNIFYSNRNIHTIAIHIQKRVFCEIRKFPDIEKNIDIIYPPENRKLMNRIGLEPYLNETYDLYAQNLSKDIEKQVDKLNYIVIIKCSNKLIENLRFHLQYIRDIESPLQMMDRPISTSNTIARALPSSTDRFF